MRNDEVELGQEYATRYGEHRVRADEWTTRTESVGLFRDRTVKVLKVTVLHPQTGAEEATGIRMAARNLTKPWVEFVADETAREAAENAADKAADRLAAVLGVRVDRHWNRPGAVEIQVLSTEEANDLAARLGG